MLVLYRFAVSEGETETFARDAEGALAALASCEGYLRGGLGRAIDDFGAEAATWMLWTEWNGVGSYRRALSNFQVKMATPLLSRALPEASGFEVLAECEPGGEPRRTGSDRTPDPDEARREASR
ncbi:antibiotic biosynthesis monooxygenase [Glycomyces sp. TRM65418]|uniref:antibiotic biosynthesis monooxygenase n=1 Tax=Glycomyces sp. TRM65418 TaxID=2867006 RepID=UPI001CE70AEC|nr:antibiotic biosynthesis monooxygenase [Glycomyces sp. TRM65418]MCC3762351.1 antibiotic biosynthesis monooxygenase [Glycomyces sp. TRM65418]QZD56403.1 antibiotic biosynthesis monooxygenase [Glycomyces sp. TRM65418]